MAAYFPIILADVELNTAATAEREFWSMTRTAIPDENDNATYVRVHGSRREIREF